MADVRPVMFRWKSINVALSDGRIVAGKVMVPHKRFDELCARQFDDGEDYALAPLDDIPSKSRAGFFADARDCYDSLHEGDARFTGFEHFRKTALIMAGWCTHRHHVMSTEKDARKMARECSADAYAIVDVKGNVVDVWTAKSIAGGGLRGRSWQEVKEKALKWCHEQVDPDKLGRVLEEKARKRGR